MTLTGLLAPGSRWRTAALWAAAALALLVFTQVLLPGTAGSSGRGTPGAVLFNGFVKGWVTALTAAGIILVYRTLRIVNFAQAGLGIAGGVLCFELIQYTPVPFPVAFLLAVALATAIGFGVGLFLLRFSRSPRLVLTVFTILLASVAAGFSNQVRNLPFFPPQQERTAVDELGFGEINQFLPFRGWSFEIGDAPFTFGFAHLFAIEASIIALLGLAAFFRYTKAGVAVRAMAENAERAALLGIGVGLLSCVVWAIAGALAGTSVTLTGLLITPGAASGLAPAVLLPALTAAVLGRFRSLPITVAAAVALGVASDAATWSLTDEKQGLVSVGMFVAIGAGLLLQRRGALRSEDATQASSWQAADEQRPIPTELLQVPGLRRARLAAIAVGVVAVGIYPFVVSIGAVNIGSVIALNAIVVLSLVVLTGWAGQVSLGQYAFVGLGAVVGGALTDKVGIPFWFAVPLAAAVVGTLAVAVGIPALRVKGLLLLVSTFALAIAVRSVLFEDAFFGWLLPQRLQRPTLFLLDFNDERSMYFLSVACLVLAIVVLANLRRSRFGRLLIAVRENEANVQSFGVSATRMKLLAFGVSGGMAGFAGAVFAHQQTNISPDSYGVEASLGVFIIAIFGGVSSVPGALIGAAYFSYIDYFFSSQLFQNLMQSVIPFWIVYTTPGGLAAIITLMRDAVLRIVAQRRQIVVPSLFADYDPDALARRLIPLGEPVTGTGLAAVGDTRYSLVSELYKGRGQRIIDKLAPARASAEAELIGAAGLATAERDVIGAPPEALA